MLGVRHGPKNSFSLGDILSSCAVLGVRHGPKNSSRLVIFSGLSGCVRGPPWTQEQHFPIAGTMFAGCVRGPPWTQEQRDNSAHNSLRGCVRGPPWTQEQQSLQEFYHQRCCVRGPPWTQEQLIASLPFSVHAVLGGRHGPKNSCNHLI